MGQSYVGEIRTVGFNFAPNGWLQCNGQLLSISEYDTLFSLIGTTYGGDGQSTFALPNLQSRIPVHMGTGPGLTPRNLGDSYGTENVTLTTATMPTHTHTLAAVAGAAASSDPTGALPANTSIPFYSDGAPSVSLSTTAVASYGGSGAHSNIQPCLTINFIISLYGVYPSQS